MKKYYLMIIFSSLLVVPSYASGANEEFKKYLNDIVQQVKKAETPAEKREILDKSFNKLMQASEYMKNLPLTSDEDKAALEILRQKTEENYNELNGYKGYSKVADSELDRFAVYSMQGTEQAGEYVTISVLTLVLIIILVAILL